METFSALLSICAGNSPVPGEFPAQRPVARSFDVFFDLLLNKRLNKQSWGWWFETISCPFWCDSYEWEHVLQCSEKLDVSITVLCKFFMPMWLLLLVQYHWLSLMAGNTWCVPIFTYMEDLCYGTSYQSVSKYLLGMMILIAAFSMTSWQGNTLCITGPLWGDSTSQ